MESRPTIACIDLDALAHNLNTTKDFIGEGTRCMAVVKADAYGHGAVECALRLEAEGIDWFGVAIPEEGVELRRAGITRPILCLGSFWPGQEQILFQYRLTPVLYDEQVARRLNVYAEKRGSTIDVHLKIDTGMGRVGIAHGEAEHYAQVFKELKRLRINGLLTHFAAADDPSENSFTELQIERFGAACDIFREAGHRPEWFDLANSPGAIAHPGSRGNMVRLGGALYGLLDDILPSGTARPDLKCVLTLRSRIVHLRWFDEGETLGYGRTFTTKRRSLIALVPIGYADGYPRGLSNRADAVVNARRAPVVGRISMDWTLLDVTDVPDATVGSDVWLIGGGPPDGVSAAELASKLDTIAYEITCGISPRVRRVYTGSRAAG